VSKQRVIVAMSGGVDSSVAAGLLLRRGYEVIGVTMRLWTQEDPAAPMHHRRCCSVEDTDDARAAADVLGIPHYVLNLEREFARDVVDYFVEEYGRGRTPNPCLACNQHVKFRSLLEMSAALGAEYLATGHYARIDRLDGRYRLLRGADRSKDQSYVLYTLGQRELSRLLFPLGGYRKEEVRQLAAEMGLAVAEKPDSVEICFVPGDDYWAFIAQRVPQAEGVLVDVDGRVLGRHRGVAGFTVGQRRRLGVALGERRFVTGVDPLRNVVTLGTEEDLFADRLFAEGVHWVGGTAPGGELEADVKIRYRTPASPAVVRSADGGAQVRFERPQRAITPGQAAVFYRGDEVLGGGVIASVGT
jgi:tRNA-specific 2-thiouridylase